VLFLGGFPFVSIPFLGPTHVVSLAIVFPNWLMWGCLFNPLSVQPRLYLFYLLGLSPLLSFVAPLWYQDPWCAFWHASFAFSFLEKVLNKDVDHVNMFLKLRDIYAFGILFWCFPQMFIFCSLLPPLPTFWN
jgi:hypothetical protein